MKLFIVFASIVLCSNADVSFPTFINVDNYRTPFRSYGLPENQKSPLFIAVQEKLPEEAPIPIAPPQHPADEYGPPAQAYGPPVLAAEPVAEPFFVPPPPPELPLLPEISKPLKITPEVPLVLNAPYPQAIKEGQVPASIYGIPKEPIIKSEVVFNTAYPLPEHRPLEFGQPLYNAPYVAAIVEAPFIPPTVYGAPTFNEKPIIKTEVSQINTAPYPHVQELPIAKVDAPYPPVQELPIAKVDAPYPPVQELPIAKVDAPYPPPVEIKPEAVYGTPIEPITEKHYVEPAAEPFFEAPPAPALPALPEITKPIAHVSPINAPYPAPVDDTPIKPDVAYGAPIVAPELQKLPEPIVQVLPIAKVEVNAPYPAPVDDTPIKPEVTYGTPIAAPELQKLPEPIVQVLPIAKVEIDAPYPPPVKVTPIKPEVTYGIPAFQQETVIKTEALPETPASAYGPPIIPVTEKLIEAPVHEKIIDAPYPPPLPFTSHYGGPVIQLAKLFK